MSAALIHVGLLGLGAVCIWLSGKLLAQRLYADSAFGFVVGLSAMVVAHA
jgi:hypothetical protein